MHGANVIVPWVIPQVDLRDHLIGKNARHRKAWVARATQKIHQTAFGQQQNMVPVGKEDLIDLSFDIDPATSTGFAAQRGHVDLVVKMPHIANDCLIFHPIKVRPADHPSITCGGDKNIGLVRRIVHCHDPITFHCRLQRANRVHLRHPDVGRLAPQGLGATLTDVPESGNQRNLSGDHHVGRTLERIN